MTPKIIATATIAVTLGRKYRVLYSALNLTKVEFSRNAMTKAKITIGIVDITQMINVFEMDFQNIAS